MEKCEEIRITLSMEEAVNFLDHDVLREMIWEKMPAPAQCEWLKKMIRRREAEIGQKSETLPLYKRESMADQEYRALLLLSKLGPSSMFELKQNPECPTFAAFDKAFIERFDGIIVLQLDGWEKSVGVGAEIEYAKKLGLPVYLLPPNQVKKTFNTKNLKKI